MRREESYPGEIIVAQLGFLTHQYRRVSNHMLKAQRLTEDHMYCLRETSTQAIPMCELSEQLKLPRYKVTRLIQELSRRGLVKVTQVSKDRRVWHVKASSKAHRLIAEVDLAVCRSIILEMPGLWGKDWRRAKAVENLEQVIEAMFEPAFLDDDPEFSRIYTDLLKQP